MKKLQVLGPGCPKCKMLAERCEQAAKELGIEYTIEKITDVNEMMKFGIMATPALVVDGAVKVMGRVPAAEELKRVLGQ